MKTQLRKTILALFAMAITSYGHSQSYCDSNPVDIHGDLSVSGNKIVDQNNSVVSFAGNSLFWSNTNFGAEKYYNANVVSWLKDDWNATIVRAAMGVEDSGGYIGDPQANKNRVTTVVDAAISEGLYVIIDWHSHSAENYRQQAIDFFREMATLYGNTPNVIYEIYNEPIGSSWSNDVKPYAEAVISAIRAIDPDNLIIVGSPTWSQDVDIASSDPIRSSTNIAYTLHFYAGTHGASLRAKAQTALNNGVALMATEWGTVNADGNGNVNNSSTDEWMNFLEANDISHLNWSVHDKSEGASILKPGGSANGNWSNSDLTASGLKVKSIVESWVQYCDGEPIVINPPSNNYTDIPALIQAEDYTSQSGTQLESTSDNGGGLNVGYIDNNDSLSYNIDVPSSGNYTINFRVASLENGANFNIFSGNSNIGNVSSNATGGWQNWQTVSETVFLNQGEQTIRLVATGIGWNINWLDFESDNANSATFTPDTNKIYYIDSPVHNLRLAASGESEDAYAASTNATGNDVRWRFVAKGNGYWHLQRAAGGTKPRLRTDGSVNADMQATSSNGTFTFFEMTQGASNNTYFFTLPNGPVNKRLQIDNNGAVKMTTNASNGSWESFTITEATSNPLDTNTNIASSGTATQSSTSHGGNASRAIDGNTNGIYGNSSVTHTSVSNNAWWQVSLNSQTNIGEIVIYNRTDSCCTQRLSNFTVSILDNNNNQVYNQTINGAPNSSITINANGASGRTIRITNNLNNTALSLAEVEVYRSNTSNKVSEKSNILNEDLVNAYLNSHTKSLNINLNSLTNYTDAIIFDVQGRKILNQKLNQNSSEISLEGYKSGIYFLRLSGLKNYTQTFIVE